MGPELVWGWGTPKYPEVIEGFTGRDVQLIPEEERRKQGAQSGHWEEHRGTRWHMKEPSALGKCPILHRG